MYEARINKLRDLMQKEGLDAYFTLNTSNIYYLTGYRGDSAYLVITLKEAYLYTYALFQIEAETQTDKSVNVKILGKTGLFDEISETLKDVKTLGIETPNLTLSMFNALYCKMQSKIRQTNDLVLGLRAQKDEREIEFIKRAQEITDRVFDHVLNTVKPDIMTELDLAAEMEYQMKKLGAEGYSFKTIVAIKENSATPHAIPRNVTITNNTNLLMDFGVYYNGYASDMTRTIFIGKADDEFKKVYNTVLSAQEKAEQAIKVGVAVKKLDKIARDIIDSAGYGEFFTHGLGHGVGIDVHENPPVNSRTGTLLKQGMVITIEPGIYLKDKFGVRIEDMVLVKKDGFEIIPKAPKNLIEI